MMIEYEEMFKTTFNNIEWGTRCVVEECLN